MSAYPMTLRSVSLDHTGGTKSYHLLLVTTNDGKSLFVSRWGKTGQLGEVKPEAFNAILAGEKAWDKKERAKTSNGYRQKGSIREETVADAGELRQKMGLPVWNKVGKIVQHLDSAIDVTGMRENDAPGYDEDGKKLDNSRKADISEAIAAEKAAQLAESEKTLRNHPNFGRFG